MARRRGPEARERAAERAALKAAKAEALRQPARGRLVLSRPIDQVVQSVGRPAPDRDPYARERAVERAAERARIAQDKANLRSARIHERAALAQDKRSIMELKKIERAEARERRKQERDVEREELYEHKLKRRSIRNKVRGGTHLVKAAAAFAGVNEHTTNALITLGKSALSLYAQGGGAIPGPALNALRGVGAL